MTETTWRPLTVALVWAVICVPATRAVDGVLEINQACIATGCFPGDAPGFPVEITQPGSYRLTGNLTVPDANTTAVEAPANDVTLDLNGFAILGPTTCDFSQQSCAPTGTGKGVFSAAAHGPTVRNGTVRGMGSHGIELTGGGLFDGSAAKVVEGIIATHNGGIGIYAREGDPGEIRGGGMVRNSLAILNGSHGISVFEGAVIGNQSFRNLGDGMVAGGLVLDNRSNRNVGVGLRFACVTLNANTIDCRSTGYGRNVLGSVSPVSGGGVIVSGVEQLGPNVCSNCQ